MNIDSFLTIAQSDAVSGLRDLFPGIGGDGQFVIVLVIAGCVTAIVITLICTIAGTIRKVRRDRLNDELKREMVERGMSAEEIVQVIEADTLPEEAVARWMATKGKGE